MAKAEAPAPKMTFSDFKTMKLKTIDAMFFLMIGLIAIGMVVGVELR